MSDYVEDYVVIEKNHLILLTDEIKKLCKKGWTPVGGVSYTGQPEGHYIQAMVKYEE